MDTLDLKRAERELRSLSDRFASNHCLQPVLIVDKGLPTMVLMSWEQFETIRETLDEYRGEEMMQAARASEHDSPEGGTRTRIENPSDRGW